MAVAMMLSGVMTASYEQESINTSSFKKASDCHDEISFNSDGPYVFYKKGLVLVRSLERQKNGNITTKKEIFTSKEDLSYLTCKVDDDSGISFKVKLHSNYEVPPSVYPQPEKLFALADIEGNFDAFTKTLKANGIINDRLEWTFGKGHLVLVGDFFDRGNNVTAVLWLIYELERQAAEKGGVVHFIIGNHEEMNLRGDTRYVKEKYFEVAIALNTKYPSLFGTNTELGKWLRSKNVIEKIGNTLFVHGGLSPQLAKYHLSLANINKVARANYGKAAWKIESSGGLPQTIFGMNGPMWYRGYFSGSLQKHEILHVLNLYGAESVVVGHTIVPNVSSLFDNRIIAIDVKHCTAIEDGTSNALFLKNGQYFAANAFGELGSVYPILTRAEIVKVFTAIRDNNPEGIDRFLSNGNNVNKYYSSKAYTLLHYAIKHDQPEIVEFLLKKGADIEQTFEAQTPLMYAVKLQQKQIADILVRHGANVNALNDDQKSVLMYCAIFGNVEILEILISNGANINIKDGKGRTAFDYALKYDNEAVAQYLKSL